MQCPSCGKSIDGFPELCPHCQAPVNQASQKPPAMRPSNASGRRVFLTLAIIAAVIFAFFVLICGGCMLIVFGTGI